MKRLLFTLTLFGAITFLVGCKLQMMTDLYSSDLYATAAANQGFTTPATLALPVTSVENCEEETAKIVAIMQGIVDPFMPKGCERRDMESYMLASLQLPLLDSMSAWDKTNSLFGIIAQQDADNNSINVILLMHLELYEILNERVKNEYFQSLDLDESKFTIILNNDERKDIVIVAKHAFVQGQPVLAETYTASRRDQISIELSDVSTAFLAQHGAVPLFVLLN